MDLNAGWVLLVSENVRPSPKMREEISNVLSKNCSRELLMCLDFFSPVSLGFRLTNAGSVCNFSSEVDWHVVRTFSALSIQRNTLCFVSRVEFNAFGGITVAALKGLSTLRLLLKYNIVIQDL